MKKEIKILYLNFWPNFNPAKFKITKLLSLVCNVRLINKDDTPDLLIYSCFTTDDIFRYDCVKLYVSGENDAPDFNVCDYAITSAHIQYGHRHLRIPYFALTTDDYMKLNTETQDYDDSYYFSRGFCSCVVGNIALADPMRINVIDAVAKEGDIAYGGSFRNNIGGRVDDKIKFISQYKFNIATENSKIDGYITEKIVDAFIAHTVPIYWGAEDISDTFNPDSFINVNDFATLDSFTNYLYWLNYDRDTYMKILNAPHILSEQEIKYNNKIVEFLKYIVDNIEKRQIPSYGRAQIITNQYKKISYNLYK